jgi:hypothetical protein
MEAARVAQELADHACETDFLEASTQFYRVLLSVFVLLHHF